MSDLNFTSIKSLKEWEENEKNNIIPKQLDYNSYIIRPPPPRDIFYDKIKTLVIDSRDRNICKFPSPSYFEINVKEEYKYVRSLQLAIAQVPPSQYLINKTNDIFNFSIGYNPQIRFEKCNEKSDYKDNNIEIRNSNSKMVNMIDVKIPNGDYPDASPNGRYLPDTYALINLLVKKSQIISPPCIIEKEYKQDGLAKILQELLQEKIKNYDQECFHKGYDREFRKNKKRGPKIEVAYDPITDNYIFYSDLSPIENDKFDWEGEQLNLYFRGLEYPYGNQEVEMVPKRTNYDTFVRDKEGNIEYEEINVGESSRNYKKNTIGQLLGFSIKNYDGYVTNNITNVEDPLIFKLTEQNFENKFTKFLIVDQYIIIQQEIEELSDPNYCCICVESIEDSICENISKRKIINQRFKIKCIIDDYSFQVYDPNDNELIGENGPCVPPPMNIDNGVYKFTNANLFSGVIKSTYRKNFQLANYVIMKIKKCHKIDSWSSSIQDSFTIIPFRQVIPDNIGADYTRTLYRRNFNPPLPRLAQIRIEMLNYDGTRYDFNGRDFLLVFVVETLNQSGKYGHGAVKEALAKSAEPKI